MAKAMAADHAADVAGKETLLCSKIGQRADPAAFDCLSSPTPSTTDGAQDEWILPALFSISTSWGRRMDGQPPRLRTVSGCGCAECRSLRQLLSRRCDKGGDCGQTLGAQIDGQPRHSLRHTGDQQHNALAWPGSAPSTSCRTGPVPPLPPPRQGRADPCAAPWPDAPIRTAPKLSFFFLGGGGPFSASAIRLRSQFEPPRAIALNSASRATVRQIADPG